MPLPTASLYPAGLSPHAQARYPTNATVTVKVRQDGAVDGYGNPTVSWVDGDTVDVWLQPQSEPVEVVVGRETVVSDWRMHDPSGSVTVSAVDRVSDGARLFEVVGSPVPRVFPAGVTHRVDVNLRLVE